MRILILSQTGAGYLNISKWDFRNLKHEFIILTTDRAKKTYLDLGDNVNVFSVGEWDETVLLLKIRQIWNFMGFDKVFAIDEFDIELAATIRDYYGLEGQNKESSKFFRDKLYMNAYVSSRGFNAPQTRKVENIFDVLKISDKIGYPFIVKPRFGAGTSDTVKIDGVDEIDKLLSIPFERDEFIIQNYIGGELYHIDCFIVKGNPQYIKTSQYLFPTLEHFKGHSTASVQLSENESKLFTNYTKRLIAIMPLPENTLLHLEIFYDGKNITFLEIGSRIGGGGVHATLVNQFGQDPLYTHLLAELNEFEKILPFIAVKEEAYGQIMVSPELGVVRSLPENLDVFKEKMSIFDLRYFARIGTIYEKRETSVQAICRICLTGTSTNEVKMKLFEVEKFIKESTIIVER